MAAEQPARLHTVAAQPRLDAAQPRLAGIAGRGGASAAAAVPPQCLSSTTTTLTHTCSAPSCRWRGQRRVRSAVRSGAGVGGGAAAPCLSQPHGYHARLRTPRPAQPCHKWVCRAEGRWPGPAWHARGRALSHPPTNSPLPIHRPCAAAAGAPHPRLPSIIPGVRERFELTEVVEQTGGWAGRGGAGCRHRPDTHTGAYQPCAACARIAAVVVQAAPSARAAASRRLSTPKARTKAPRRTVGCESFLTAGRRGGAQRSVRNSHPRSVVDSSIMIVVYQSQRPLNTLSNYPSPPPLRWSLPTALPLLCSAELTCD